MYKTQKKDFLEACSKMVTVLYAKKNMQKSVFL